MAQIEDVFLSLDMPKVTPDDLREFGTLSGYLCSQVVTSHALLLASNIFEISMVNDV